MRKSLFKDGILTVYIEGRIDTFHVSEMEKCINDATDKYPDFSLLVIDASGLEYICSSGLRVILATKNEYGYVSIINVCPNVYNVFKMTGFTRIIDIEKALTQYVPTEDTLVKVYPKGTTRATVDADIALSRSLFAQGIPTVMTFEVCLVGENYGLCYERRDSPVVTDAAKIGSMLRQLHESNLESWDIVPSLKERNKNRIASLSQYLQEEAVAHLDKINELIPEYICLLHGALSPERIIENDGELLLSTIGDVAVGNPMLDLAHLYSTLSPSQREDYFDEILTHYYNDMPSSAISKQKEQIAIMSLIDDFLKLDAEEKPSSKTIETYRQQAQTLIIDKWAEIEMIMKFTTDFRQELRKLENKGFYTNADINIDWLARHLGTNRHYVSEYFNKVLHKSFSEYINTLRLDYAVSLLRSGKVKQSQIAYTCGFNNEHTFRRVFKERFGCTPMQYTPEK